MPKLRSSTIVRHYDPDDEDSPKRRKRDDDPIRQIAKVVLVGIVLYLIYQALHPH